MDFQVNLNLLGWFSVCVLLESFIKFPVDPYYEPLSWFMIHTSFESKLVAIHIYLIEEFVLLVFWKDKTKFTR